MSKSNSPTIRKSLISLLLTIIVLLMSLDGWAQDERFWKISAQVHQSFIMKPTDGIAHLIRSHPNGITLQANRLSTGVEPWQKHYNFPDRGYTLKLLNHQNEVLGKSIAIMPHYRFYFTNIDGTSQITFRTGLGFAYNTNPYDPVTNNKNNLLGSTLGYSMDLALGYSVKLGDRIDGLLEISYTHLSNASFRRPNSGVNLLSSNLGLQYQLSAERPERNSISVEKKKGFGTLVSFATGFSEAQVVGSGTFPFYVGQLGVEYRLNNVSAISLGTEAFWTLSLKEDIDFPTDINDQGSLDYKRMSINIGHELFIARTSFIVQVGHYYYRPYNAFKRFYQRYGLRYYFTPSVYGSFSIKTHYGNTETAEFGIGYKWNKK